MLEQKDSHKPLDEGAYKASTKVQHKTLRVHSCRCAGQLYANIICDSCTSMQISNLCKYVPNLTCKHTLFQGRSYCGESALAGRQRSTLQQMVTACALMGEGCMTGDTLDSDVPWICQGGEKWMALSLLSFGWQAKLFIPGRPPAAVKLLRTGSQLDAPISFRFFCFEDKISLVF